MTIKKQQTSPIKTLQLLAECDQQSFLLQIENQKLKKSASDLYQRIQDQQTYENLKSEKGIKRQGQSLNSFLLQIKGRILQTELVAKEILIIQNLKFEQSQILSNPSEKELQPIIKYINYEVQKYADIVSCQDVKMSFYQFRKKIKENNRKQWNYLFEFYCIKKAFFTEKILKVIKETPFIQIQLINQLENDQNLPIGINKENQSQIRQKL